MAKVAATLRCLTDVARESALFELEHSYLSTTPEATIIITDRRGATVANAKMNDTEWQWNLTDLNGKPVSNGTYTASVLTTDGRRYTASAPVTFTVLR
jgi:flagellar hook assembly protein FlgD